MGRLWLSGVMGVFCAGFVQAQEMSTVREFEGSFGDATFSLEAAIVGRGLVVDHVSHVGAMLARTGEAVGSDVTLFDAADVYLFCSAVVSRQVMEADPRNIAHCPYAIYVADQGGTVTIGHRNYAEASMQPVRDLLDGIMAETLGE